MHFEYDYFSLEFLREFLIEYFFFFFSYWKLNFLVENFNEKNVIFEFSACVEQHFAHSFHSYSVSQMYMYSRRTLKFDFLENGVSNKKNFTLCFFVSLYVYIE